MGHHTGAGQRPCTQPEPEPAPAPAPALHAVGRPTIDVAELDAGTQTVRHSGIRARNLILEQAVVRARLAVSTRAYGSLSIGAAANVTKVLVACSYVSGARKRDVAVRCTGATEDARTAINVNAAARRACAARI